MECIIWSAYDEHRKKVVLYAAACKLLNLQPQDMAVNNRLKNKKRLLVEFHGEQNHSLAIRVLQNIHVQGQCATEYHLLQISYMPFSQSL